MMIIAAIFAYYFILTVISRVVNRRSSNAAFFRGERRSPWYMVAFGMVGASISGVTFVSVPGMVLTSQMSYLQLCIGFILGYLAVAFVLLPVYYRLNVTSIYSYIGERLGHQSYQTAAWFFLLSKMCGAALKFYVVCMIMQKFVFQPLNIPFWVTVIGLVMLIWLYTRRGGIRTLVFTDTFQTFCLFSALFLIIYKVMSIGGWTVTDALSSLWADERSQVFFFDDFSSPQNFWKMLLSGLFIVVVMTGLDQDMMQKNLTCKTLRDAQKDMCTYGLAFLPANFLFLALGVLLTQLFSSQGIAIPAKGDELLPLFVEQTGGVVLVLFAIGIVAASFSSADSAITSMTTSYCVDIRGKFDDERLRHRVHISMCAIFAAVILICDAVNSSSLIDAIYTMVSYTYGPLLGLFAFGLFTRQNVRDRYVPVVCIASPLLSYLLSEIAKQQFGYHFGYELLLCNGLFCFLGLLLIKTGRPRRVNT
ncbi:MAG: sodium:solute symporter [Prevotella sp.]|nr:sodium:solute symporter [Prevotella sp.]